MKYFVGLVCAAAVAFSGNFASADTEWDFGFDEERMSVMPHGIRIEIDPSMADVLPYPDTPASHGGSHVFFLNRCEGGVTISPGNEDSRLNTSSIIGQIAGGAYTFPPYPYGDASWNQLMIEVRDIMAPFGIIVTDEDPGSAPHHEGIVCGDSGGAVLGVAPGTCGVIENSISFTFAGSHGNEPRVIAHTVAQEVAHAWGLDHEYDCEDVMTYLRGCGNKYYVNDYLNCAGVQDNSWVAQPCQCGGTTQNSFARIQGIFGGPIDPTPPSITITEPQENAVVEGGFVVRATIEDNEGIQSAALYVDGSKILELTDGPFAFNGPDELADGSHRVEVRAIDGVGTAGSDEIYVIVGEPCAGPGDCEDGETCVDGRCVLGECPGGLGCNCNIGDNCQSRQCGSSGDDSFCVESCNPELEGCPSGFDCRGDGNGGGVCWPSGGDGGGCGCAVPGRGRDRPWAAFGFLCLIGLILLRRRRS